MELVLISCNPITWDIIKDNPDKPWDWAEISCNPNITWDIIKDNPDISWDWFWISYNPNINMKIIKENFQINLELVEYLIILLRMIKKNLQ